VEGDYKMAEAQIPAYFDSAIYIPNKMNEAASKPLPANSVDSGLFKV
jgi:hypothetical protein